MTSGWYQRAVGIVHDPAFKQGVRDMLAPMPGVAAWGLVTGVAMIKSGMSLPLAVFMTLLVYAGSAQLAVLPLMVVGAPLWVIWFTATCVNLRFVILSALWRSYFGHLRLRHRLAVGYFSGDVIFVTFMKRYAQPGQSIEPKPEQVPYFWGAAWTNWIAWQLASLAGIFMANMIPLAWGLGFAGVLALLGVLYSMLNERATWVACVVSAAAAVAAFGMPLKLNILVAIACAIAAGLLMEAAERHAKQLHPKNDNKHQRITPQHAPKNNPGQEGDK